MTRHRFDEQRVEVDLLDGQTLAAYTVGPAKIASARASKTKDSAIVTVAGTWVEEPPPPPPPDPTDPPPFATRPAAARVGSSSTAFQLYRGATDVEISGKSFRGLGAGVEAIRFEGCQRVWVHDCDGENIAQFITAWNTTDIRIEDNRFRNILGPHARTGRNLANFVQLAASERVKVLRNKGIGGDTEDMVSIYKTPHAEIAYNHFESPLPPDPLAWSSGSGSGIALCDGQSFDNHAHHNILLNVGQVGMFIAGGRDSSMEDNIVIGEKRPGSNVGMYVADYSGGCAGNHAVRRNRVRWVNAAGAVNGKYLPSSCPGTKDEGNSWNDTSLDPNAYHVVL